MVNPFPTTFQQLLVQNPEELADIAGLKEAGRELNTLNKELKGIGMTGSLIQSTGPDDKKTS